MIRRELPADSQHLGDHRGLRAVHLSQGKQHAKADIAVLPVARVQAVHLEFAAVDVVPGAAVDFLFVDDTVLDQRVQVVSRGPNREAKRPRDRTEVVPGQQTQMVVDLSTNRMLESRQQTQADQETPSIRQVATARPGGRPDKHADRAERSGERVLPPPPPIHEKPCLSFIPNDVFQASGGKDFVHGRCALESTFRRDLRGARFHALKSRCGCSAQMGDEFADGFANVPMADRLRGDDEEERLRPDLRCDDLTIAARDGNRPGTRSSERFDNRVDRGEHRRRHHADDVQPDSISSPRGEDRSGPSQEEDRIEAAFRVDCGEEREGGVLQPGC